MRGLPCSLNSTGYNGPLSITQIADGKNAALRNAARLAKDARLLVDADRLPSAVSLTILSIEKVGKISILRALAFAEI